MLQKLKFLTANRTSLFRLNAAQMNSRCHSDTAVKNDAKSVNVEEEDEDMPIEIESPYLEERPCCILCKYKIEVNYKNTRLLSQFISSYPVLLYERNITGLCERQHRAVRQHIKVARQLNLMPRLFKNPKYKDDPKLFNPFDPLRENNY